MATFSVPRGGSKHNCTSSGFCRSVVDAVVALSLYPKNDRDMNLDDVDIELDYGDGSIADEDHNEDSFDGEGNLVIDEGALEAPLPDDADEDSGLIIVSSDTSTDSSGSGEKISRKRHHEHETVEGKKFRVEQRSPSSSTSFGSEKSDREIYEAKKREARNYIANRTFQYIDVSERFSSGFREQLSQTIAKCLLRKNRKLEYYEELKDMDTYNFCGAIVALLLHVDLVDCGPLVGRDRAHVVTVLESYQNLCLLANDVMKSSGPCTAHQPFSFAKLTEDDGELHLYERGALDHPVMQPLGTAFDGEVGFLFTGNRTEIMRCNEQGEDIEVLVKTAANPTAIVVIRCGERFAFLDNNGIHTYDFRDKSVRHVATGLLNPKGLAYLASGVVITAHRRRGATHISAYDVNACNKEVSSTLYHDNRSVPCFMASSNNNIFMTNLNATTMNVYVMSKEGLLKRSKTISLKENFPRQFEFPSGIAADAREEVLLCDARQHGFLMWGGATLNLWKEVLMTKPFPYTASMAISPSGTLLAACRRSNSMRLYSFKK